MLATLCSNPAATKAAIGGTIARIRSVVVRALKDSQTARQTSALHIMPSAMAGTNSSPALAFPMARAAEPDAAVAEGVLAGDEHDDGRRQGADEVARCRRSPSSGGRAPS